MPPHGLSDARYGDVRRQRVLAALRRGRERDARLRVLAELREWLAPAVDAEAAAWAAADRADIAAREQVGERVIAIITPYVAIEDTGWAPTDEPAPFQVDLLPADRT